MEGDAGYARPEELQRLGDRDVSLAVLDLVFSTPDWVHRRGESVLFVTDTILRRRVTLDITVPNPCPASVEWFDGSRVCLLPIDVPEKRPLVGFDTSHEDGRPFSVLTRRQNGEVAWRGMVAYANQVLAVADHAELSEQGIEVIRRIVQEQEERSARLVSRFEQLAERHAAARVLFDDEGFNRSIWMLARNFLLIAAVPVTPGCRTILKFSYEGARSTDNRDRRMKRLESLGWEPTTAEVRVPAFSDCESFHFEAIAPEGMDIIDIVLGDEARVRDDKYDGSWALGYKRVVGSSPHRAHLAVSRTSNLAARQDEFLDPTVSVRLQVSRSGWFRSAALAALLVAAALAASLPYVVGLGDSDTASCPMTTQIPSNHPQGARHHGDGAVFAAPLCAATQDRQGLNTDPAALMVALVGVVSIAVVRTGEHAFTASRIRPLRLVALASALMPVGGAWLLVFPGPGRLLTAGWIVLSVASAAAAGLLGWAWFRGAR